LDTKVVRNSGIESHPGITLITPIETVSKNRVDEILEKISLLGIGSITNEEVLYLIIIR
jgi:hypothetical protein